MLRWIAFWTAAAVVSASVAYVVAVPGTLDPTSEAPEAPQEREGTAQTDDTAQPADIAAIREAGDAAEPEPAPAPEGEREPAPQFRLDRAPQSPLLDEPERSPEPGAAGLPQAPALPVLPVQPATPPQPAAPRQPRPPELGVLPVDGVPFNAECGLLLRPAGEAEVIFASGISLDPAGAPAAIVVDGDMVRLSRVGFEGEPLGYNQFPRQLYRDDAESVAVIVEIELEEDVAGDVARVRQGTLTVMKAERPPMELAIAGRAGC